MFDPTEMDSFDRHQVTNSSRSLDAAAGKILGQISQTGEKIDGKIGLTYEVEVHDPKKGLFYVVTLNVFEPSPSIEMERYEELVAAKAWFGSHILIECYDYKQMSIPVQHRTPQKESSFGLDPDGHAVMFQYADMIEGEVFHHRNADLDLLINAQNGTASMLKTCRKLLLKAES